MKKVFFALAITLFISVLCPAKEIDTVMQPDKHEPLVKEIKADNTRQGVIAVQSITFTGKIDSITEPSVAQSLKYEITVVDNKGDKKTFSLIPGLMIMDYLGYTIPLKSLQPGDKVVVEYVTSKSGVNRTMSVTKEKQ